MRRNLLVLTGVICLATTAIANTITTVGNGGTYGGYGPWQTGQGGEFTFVPDGQLSSVLNGYASVAENQVPGYQSFQTFCVEDTEYISAGVPYNVNFNTKSVYGNVTLNKGTAWLYEQFAKGKLAGYDYANLTADGRGGSAHPTGSAAALQTEIWFLMGQADGGTGNPYYDNLVHTAATAGGWNVMDPNAGQFHVAVLNLWSGPVGTGAAQDQLVLVPDGGLTVMLLGMGLSGVGFLARRMSR
jgi:hypothetical protein